MDIETAAKRFASIIKRTAPRHGLSAAECERAIRSFRDRLLSAPVSADTGDTLALPLQREAMAAALELVHRHRELPESILPLRHDREVPIRRAQLADRTPVSGALARALDTLPDTSRGVVRMYLAGYGEHEIGDLLGWTNGELRATLHRGFAELRDAMSGMGCAPEAWE